VEGTAVNKPRLASASSGYLAPYSYYLVVSFTCCTCPSIIVGTSPLLKLSHLPSVALKLEKAKTCHTAYSPPPLGDVLEHSSGHAAADGSAHVLATIPAHASYIAKKSKR
jgi:hypothetical protein